MPAIQAEFHLSTAMVGLLGSASYAGYLVATLLGSTLSGTLGPRGPIIAGGLAAACGMTLIGLASSVPWLAAGIVLAGTSPGLAYPPLSDAVVQLRTPERQGRTYALINSGTSYGVMVSAPVALWAGQQWQLAWLAFAAIAAVATLWNSRIMPTAAPRGNPRAAQPLRWQWLVQPRAIPLYGGALLFGVTSAVYWTFAVDHIAGRGNLPGGSAQLFWILVGLAGVAGGGAGDGVARFGLRATFRAALLANAAACVLLGLLASQWWALLLSAVLFGSTFILITGLFGIWSVHVFQERPSAGFGTTFFLISAGQLISPAIAGYAADHLGLGLVFDLAGIGTLAVIACLPSADIWRMSDAKDRNPPDN
nr:MFS transporter [Salinisphaera sp. LB1]